MKRNFILSVLAVTISLCLASCKPEPTPPVVINPGDKVNAELTVGTAPYYVAGVETADARTAMDIWVLEFDADGKNVLASKINSVKMGEAFTHEVIAGSDMKFVVIANPGTATFTEGAFNYTQFSEMGYEGTMTASADIPFVGTKTVSITKDNQEVEAISVSRIASVVSFKFEPEGEYEMTTFQLKNVPNKIYYIPQGENSAWTADKFHDIAAVEADGEEHTYIVGENLQGTVAGIADAKDKVTDKLAMHVEVLAEKEGAEVNTSAAFRFYFGENETTSFDVARNKEYAVNETIDFDDASDARVSLETIPVTQQAAASNCYMLSPDKVAYLGIPVSRANEFWNTAEGGNTKANVISDGENGGGVTAWKARIMWTDTTDEIIQIASDSGTSANDYIAVKAMGEGKIGNAIVGIFDATAGEPAEDALPLWSWHIWVTDYNPGGDLNGEIPNIEANPGQAEVAGGKVFRVKGIGSPSESSVKPAMMDRNLGALSADPKDGVKTIGAFYQWGRKDPFIMPQNIENPKTFEVAKTIPGPVAKQAAVQNPTTHISGSNNWLNADEKGLWKNTSILEPGKTLYDPCPAGWRVNATESFLDSDKASDNTTTSPKSENGLFAGNILYANAGLNIYFPLSGSLMTSGKMSSMNFDSSLYLWTGTAYMTEQARQTTIYNPAIIDPYDGPFWAIVTSQNSTRAYGCSVRCVRE